MNAQQKQEATERTALLTKLQAFPERRLATYVIDNALPAATSKWTLDQLRSTVNALNSKETNVPAATKPAATKKAATKPAPAPEKAAPTAFLVSFASTAKDQPRVQGFGDPAAATAAGEQIGEGQECYVITKPEDLKELEKPTMLAIFNSTVETPVEKFANRAAANEQVFSVLATVAEKQAPTKAKKTAAQKKAATDGQKGGGRRTAVQYPAKAAKDIKAVRRGTKLALLIDLMFQKGGTTLQEITEKLSATGKPIIARAWLGYDFASIAGYGARQDEAGRIYGVLPEGLTAPLPHKPTADEEKAAAKAAKETKKAEQATAKEEKAAAKKTATKKAAPAAAPTPEPAQAQTTGNASAPSNEAVDAATGSTTPDPEAPVPAPAKKTAAKKAASKKAAK